MNSRSQPALILLRTQQVDEQVTRFARDLESGSGLEVCFLLDERDKTVVSDRREIISLNPRSYAQLGLFAPADVSWRCGDYGIYLAARVWPQCQFFWLVEDDVRIAGDIQAFFARCGRSKADLLAVNLREADRDHFWWPHTVSNDVRPYRCFFGIVRLSSEAVRRCYRKRLEHGRKLNRIALWPNDESLVATTVMNGGLVAADFNDLGAELYDLDTFSILGESIAQVPRAGAPRLLHPVRFGERRESTANRRIDDSALLPHRLRRAVIRRLNMLSAW